MANNKIKTRIQNKHDFEVNWLNATFPPMKGELIIYDAEVNDDGSLAPLPEGRTTRYTYARYKIGDGVTPVNELPFAGTDISWGASDPDATTLTQFYFKHNS